MIRNYFKINLRAALLILMFTPVSIFPAYAGPSGGEVVRGAAEIEQNESVSRITQDTSKAVINWQDFSIAGDESVIFYQPDSNAVTLNRVTGNNLSEIYGTLDANGNVFLINRNGILFGEGAEINTGGLLASTFDIADDDFMSGRYDFTIPGLTDSSVINNGNITIADSGFAAFVAPYVSNSGIISAKLGTVAMGSTVEGYSLDLYGDNLINFAISDETAESMGINSGSAGIENSGSINADGGTVLMTAKTAGDILNSIIISGGEVRARSIEQKDGKIILSGDRGSSVTVSETAVLDASGPDSKGGNIEISGNDILIEGELNATGATGGGEILIGGGWQGSGDMLQAESVTMTEGAVIDAGASYNGDGGTVVLWSDVTKENSQTRAYGTILANGGENGGDGGRIETSGHYLDIAGADVRASAAAGKSGLWLLDPADAVIDQAVADTYAGTLNSGTDVTNTVTGSIITSGDVSLLKDAGGDATLTLQATEYIALVDSSYIGSYSQAAADGYTTTIQSTSGKLNIVINPGSDGSTGGFWLPSGSSILTNGGDITVGGGAGASSVAVGVTENSYEWNSLFRGVAINGTLNAQGGNITLKGQGATEAGVSAARGVHIAGTVSTTGTGTISITGTPDGGSAGIGIGDTSIYALGAGSIITENGDITLIANDNGTGVAFQQSLSTSLIQITGSGNLSLTSNGSFQGTGIFDIGGATTLTGGTNNLSLTNSSNDFTGNITIVSGQDISLNDTNDVSMGAAAVSGTLTINSDGDITINEALALSGSGKDLQLKASGNIIQKAGANITATGGNITYWSDSDATNGGYININSSTINSNGGAISLVGGTDGNGYAEGTSTQTASPPHQDGISITSSNLNSGGGTITLKGKGYAGYLTNHGGGLWAGSGSGSINTDGGDLIMDVQAQDNGSGQIGIRYGAYLDGITISTNGGDVQISTASPNLTWTGFHSNSTISAGAGNITLSTDQISLNGATFSGTGSLTIQPITSNTSIGIAGGAGTLNIDAIEWGYFQDGFSSITVGRSDGSGLMTANGFTFNDNLTLLTGSGGIQINGALSGGSNNLTLTSTGTVSDGAGGSITASVLNLTGSDGIFNLDSAVSDVDTLTAATGTVVYSDADDIALGSVSTAYSFSLTSSGTITTSELIDGDAGSITLTADGMTLGANIQGTGSLTLTPYSAGTTIGLAGGAGTLNLDTTELNYLQDGLSGTTIGSINSGAMTVNSHTFIDQLTLLSGGNININGSLTLSSAGDDLLIKTTEDIIQAGNVDVTTNGGDITYWSDSDDNSSGSIMISPTANSAQTTIVSSGGGDIVMGGGSNPLTDYAWNTDTYEGGINIDRYAVLDAGTGDITLNGANSFTAGENGMGIRIYQSSGISGNNITVRGLGSANSTAGAYGNNFGVSLDGSSITGTGAIDISGTAGGSNSNTGNNDGIYITSGSSVSATGSGTVTMTGTGGGNGTDNNNGIKISGTVQTQNGDITLDGRSGTGDSSGVFLDSTGSITSTDGSIILSSSNSDITIKSDMTANGTGDILVKAAGSITQNHTGAATALSTNGGDVILWADSDVNNSGSIHIGNDGTENLDPFPDSITTSGGMIVLAGGADDGANGGTAGDGIPDGFAVNPDYIGVEVDEEFTLNSGTGDIIIRGKSTFTGDDYGYGVYLDRGINITGGDIYITGIGSDSIHNYNSGVHMFSNDTLAGSITAGGNIVIDGTAAVSSGAGGDNNDGIRISEYSVITAVGNISLAGRKNDNVGINSDAVDMVGQLSSTGGGTITLTGDTLNLNYATASIASTGALVIETETAGTTIGLAGGTGTLNLDTTELGKIQNGFSGITIGHADAGAVNIGGTVTFNDSLTLLTGSGINIDGAVTAAENLTLTSGGAISQSEFLSVAGSTDINAGTQTVTLDHALNIFDSDNSGSLLTVDGGSVTIYDSEILRLGTSNVGTLTAESGNNLLLNGTVTATADMGDDNSTSIVLAAGENFIEGAGGDLNPGTGRFIVYSQNQGLNTYDDLTAVPWYNTTYNSADPTAVSGTGDRFAFAQTATLTVTADNKSRAYGSANPELTQTVSGYINGETDSILSGSASGSTTAAAATAVGNAVITAGTGTLATDRNYNFTTANGTLTINPASLTITADNRNKTYGDTLSLGTTAFTATGLKNNETVGAVTLSSTGGYDLDTGTPAGTYAGDITAENASGGTFTASNYSITYNTGDFTVNTAELSITADDRSKTYGDSLALGTTAFTSSGLKNNETIGSVILSSTGGYDTDTTVSAGTYAGDITAQNASGGTFTASNYSITYNTGDLTVNTAELSITADDRSRTYGDSLTLGTTAFTSNGLKNNETIGSVILSSTGGYDTDTTASAGTYAGDITAGNASGGTFTASNYSITYNTGDLTVNTAELTITADDRSRTYGDSLALGTTAFTTNGLKNNETVGSVILSSTGGYDTDTTASAGTYAGDITAGNASGGTFTASNYSITYNTGDLTVDAAELSITADDRSKTYGDTLTLGTAAFTSSGLKNGETIGSVILSSIGGYDTDTGASAGTYIGDITAENASGGTFTASNYSITYNTGDLTVTPASLTVTAADDSKTYNGLAYTGGNGITYAGFVNNETADVIGGNLSYTGTSQGAVNAGNYVITPYGLTSGNYEIHYENGALTVNKAEATVTANSGTAVYNGRTLAVTGFTAEGLVNGETVSVLDGVTTSGGSGINVGTYIHTAYGTDENYRLTFIDGAKTITPAALTVTAADASKTYDGIAYSGGNGVTYNGFVNNETSDVLTGNLIYTGTSQGAVNAGSYILTPDGLASGNYSITYINGDLIIEKANATVTASSMSTIYNGLTQSVTGFTAEGLVNGETVSVLDGITTSGGSGLNAGEYIHTAEGTDENYTLTFIDGALNITPASLTVTANDETKTSDGTAYSGGNGVTYEGFAADEDESDLGGELEYGGTSQGAVDAGSYTIAPDGLESSNYEIDYEDGTLTITNPVNNDPGESPPAGTEGGAGTEPAGDNDEGTVTEQEISTEGGDTGTETGTANPLPDISDIPTPDDVETGTGDTEGSFETGSEIPGDTDDETGSEETEKNDDLPPGTLPADGNEINPGIIPGTEETDTEEPGSRETGADIGTESDTAAGAENISEDSYGSSDPDSGAEEVNEAVNAPESDYADSDGAGSTEETGADAVAEVSSGEAAGEAGGSTGEEASGDSGNKGAETEPAEDGAVSGNDSAPGSENNDAETADTEESGTGETPMQPAKVEIVEDGSFDLTAGDGNTISGISMPDVKVSMEGNTLQLKRQRPAGSSSSGMATTVAVVVKKKGQADTAGGGYIIMDEDSKLTVMPYDDADGSDFEPGDHIFDISIELKAKNGSSLKYNASLSEFGLTITPEDSAAHEVAETRPDLVLGLALVELQKKKDIVIDDLEAVVFEL